MQDFEASLGSVKNTVVLWTLHNQWLLLNPRQAITINRIRTIKEALICQR